MWAASSAQTINVTPLKEQPAFNAQALAQLPAAHELAVLTRQGGWYQVTPTGYDTGWVNMMAIRFSQQAYRPGEMGVSQAVAAMSGQQSSVVTTAVRGLSAQDLKTANPDLRALGQFTGLAVDKAQAERFAAQAKLVKQQGE